MHSVDVPVSYTHLDFDRAAVLALLEQNAHRAAEQTATVPLSLLHIQMCIRDSVIALGAGLGIWGAITLLEGYGNDNPGANAHVRQRSTKQNKDCLLYTSRCV